MRCAVASCGDNASAPAPAPARKSRRLKKICSGVAKRSGISQPRRRMTFMGVLRLRRPMSTRRHDHSQVTGVGWTSLPRRLFPYTGDGELSREAGRAQAQPRSGQAFEERPGEADAVEGAPAGAGADRARARAIAESG